LRIINVTRKMNKRILILIILVIVGLFYWYEWRPSQIKKYCNQWALDKSKTSDTTYNREGYENYYARCLREKGY